MEKKWRKVIARMEKKSKSGYAIFLVVCVFNSVDILQGSDKIEINDEYLRFDKLVIARNEARYEVYSRTTDRDFYGCCRFV